MGSYLTHGRSCSGNLLFGNLFNVRSRLFAHYTHYLYSEHIGDSKFDTGAMAKISDGYTVGAVASCINEVITCKRKLQLRVQPLTHAELINVLR